MPKEFKGKVTSFVHLIADDKGNLPSEIMVLPIGDFNTEPYGLMQITADHIAQIVNNFKNNVRKAVPVDVDHDGGKAAGWINDLIAKADGAWAKVDWTSLGQDLLTNKIYKFFSPEWSFDYVDPEHGTPHGATLIAGSLTNRPLFKELPFIVANESGGKKGDLTNSIILLFNENTDMKLEELLKKAKSELTDAELAFVKKNEDKLSDADKKKFLADEGETDAEKAAREEKELKEKEEADAQAAKEKEEADAAEAKAKEEKEAADKKANEGKTVTITANEHAEFLKAKEANIKAQEELKKVKVAEEVTSKFIANEKGGKVFLKSKDALVDFVMKCSDEQKTALYTILETLPDLKVAGEAGDEQNTPLTAQKELGNLVDEAVKKANELGEKVTRHQIEKSIIASNNDLAKRLEEEIAKGNK
jgi:hypothetical protein